MLKRPPRAEDDHGDSLVLSKNVGNSNFQGATRVSAITGNGLYPLLYVKLAYSPCIARDFFFLLKSISHYPYVHRQINMVIQDKK